MVLIDKLYLLKSISFGERVAEDEINELAKYFVETDQWSRMVQGEIDIVRGAKGSWQECHLLATDHTRKGIL
jgi:hypothetical protein